MKAKGLAISAMALTGVLVVGALAVDAGVNPKVRKHFRGKILITDHALSSVDPNPKKTIKAWKKARLKEVKHSMVDGVATWQWHYKAFLRKKPMVNMLSFDFYTADKKAEYKANKKIGVDPRVTVLEGTLTISEDDNLSKGKTYVVKLVGEVRGKEVTFAKTKITVK